MTDNANRFRWVPATPPEPDTTSKAVKTPNMKDEVPETVPTDPTLATEVTQATGEVRNDMAGAFRLARETLGYLKGSDICVLEADPRSTLAADLSKITGKSVMLVRTLADVKTNLPKTLEESQGRVLVILCDPEMEMGEKGGPINPGEGYRVVEETASSVNQWNTAHPDRQIKLDVMVDTTWGDSDQKNLASLKATGFQRVNRENIATTTLPDVVTAIKNRLREAE